MGTKSTAQDLSSFLKSNKALSEAFTAACHSKSVPKGTAIIQQGDKDRDLYILTSGRAKVVLYSEGGHEIWFAELTSGASFGEMAVLLEAPRSSSVIAEKKCELQVIGAQAFETLLKDFPELSWFMAQLMAQHLRGTTRALFESLSFNAGRRVYEDLLRRAENGEHENTNEILRLFPAPTVTDLSGQLNLSREATSRAISNLGRKGLLKKNGKTWDILRPEFGPE